MTIPLLVLIDSVHAYHSLIESHGFRLIVALDPEARARAIREHASEIRAVLTRGSTGFTADEMAALPNLEVVSCLGVGFENVDLAAAQMKGIIVTNGPGANATSVADHAMALLLGTVRRLPTSDAAVRGGSWEPVMAPQLTGKRMGVLGMGSIGMEIAKRGANGFGMSIGYHNRRPQAESAYTYYATPLALAANSDFLMIATPGGTATSRLVDAAVLDALGPDGYLVNIARGSVVDTNALIHALSEGRIAGAGLDVVDGEPVVPAGLLGLENVVLTPHSAGRSPEAAAATVRLFLDNLQAHFSGLAVYTPVAVSKH